MAQEVIGAGDGRVKIDGIGLDAEAVGIVFQHSEHEGIAARKVMLVDRSARHRAADVRIAQVHKIIHHGHVAGLAIEIEIGIIAIDPLMVGGLLGKPVAGDAALQINGLRHEGVACSAESALLHMGAVADHEVVGGKHGRDDGARKWAVDGAGGVENELARKELAERIDALAVARHATHAIEAQGVVCEHGHAVIGLSLALKQVRIAAERGVALQALVFGHRLQAGIGEDLMAHLCAPKRILGGIGHHGALPVVRHVDVAAHCIHQTDAVGIMAMAIFTNTRGHEVVPVHVGKRIDGMNSQQPQNCWAIEPLSILRA